MTVYMSVIVAVTVAVAMAAVTVRRQWPMSGVNSPRQPLCFVPSATAVAGLKGPQEVTRGE